MGVGRQSTGHGAVGGGRGAPAYMSASLSAWGDLVPTPQTPTIRPRSTIPSSPPCPILFLTSPQHRRLLLVRLIGIV